MPDISKIEVNGVEYDIKDPVARANSEGAPRDAVLYTEQSLADSQKAQARGNIGAVGTVESTEEVYTYVFTGEEETAGDGDVSSYAKYLDNVTPDFVRSLTRCKTNFPECEEYEAGEMAEETIGDVLTFYNNNVLTLFYTEVGGVAVDEEFGGFILPKRGMYLLDVLALESGGEYQIVSITSTIPYTKTTKKIDESLIPELCLKSPSGKKFKLTVDDTGTISATEVV